MAWVDEKEAAVKVKRKPDYLRRKVKAGAWPVKFRHFNGRSFQYDEKDLENLFTIRRSA